LWLRSDQDPQLISLIGRTGDGGRAYVQVMDAELRDTILAMVLDEVAVEPIAPPARRSRRRLWISLVIAAVLLAAGTITSVSIGSRYARATALECACGLAWGPTQPGRTVRAGPYTAMIATARPGHVQSFYVLITNPSSVTQTILGLRYPDDGTAEPVDLAVARRGSSLLDDQQEYDTRHFISAPVSIEPHGVRWLRVSIHTASAQLWSRGREEWWDNLVLRVRIGWFDRIETLGFASRTAFVLEGA